MNSHNATANGAGSWQEPAEEGGPLARLDKALLENTYTFDADDIETDPEPVRCLWGHYIVAGEVNVLSGPGGAGKSSMLAGLAVAGAAEQFFLGRPTQEFRTVIFTTEDSRTDWLRKIHAWKSTYPTTWREAKGRIHVIPLKGIPLRLVESAFGQVQVAPGVVELLATHVRRLVPTGDVLVLVETVSRVSGGDETNAGAGMLVVALERLALLTSGGTTMPVSHVGKSNMRERVVDMYASRGASALPDNARSALVLQRPPPEVLKKAGIEPGEEPDYLFGLFHAKHNNTPKEPDLLLRREAGKHAAFFEPWEAARRSSGVEEESEEAAGGRVGRRLREVVLYALEQDKRKWVTARMLRDEYRDRLGLAKGRIAAAVDRAVADHWLQEGANPVRGGGHPLLPDDPERWNRPGEPAQNRPEPARASSSPPTSTAQTNWLTPLRGKGARASSKSLAAPNRPRSGPGQFTDHETEPGREEDGTPNGGVDPAQMAFALSGSGQNLGGETDPPEHGSSTPTEPPEPPRQSSSAAGAGPLGRCAWCGAEGKHQVGTQAFCLDCYRTPGPTNGLGIPPRGAA